MGGLGTSMTTMTLGSSNANVSPNEKKGESSKRLVPDSLVKMSKFLTYGTTGSFTN